MNNIAEIITNIVMVIWSIVGLIMSTSFGAWLIERVQSAILASKGSRRAIVFEWLKEAMIYTQKTYSGGSQQKAEALKLIDKRLADNKMTQYFTAEQIEQMLESTFVELRSKGLV